MKKFASILALSALLLSSFVFPAFAEEPLVGGWFANVENPTDIPQDVLDAFNAAMEGVRAASTSLSRCWAVRSSRA